MKAWKKTRQRFDRILRPILVAGILSAILLSFQFDFLEARLYDFRMRFGPQAPADSDIVLVLIDKKTTQALNDYAPLPLSFHANLLEKLTAFSPKGVGYLVNMNHVNQVDPELFSDQDGARFIVAARSLGQRKIPFLFGTPFDINGEVIPPYPLSSLDHAIAIIHKDGNIFSEDKVTRRAMTQLYGRPTFHLEMARRIGAFDSNAVPHGQAQISEIDADYFLFRYHGDPANEPYTRYSAIDLIRGEVALNELQGKTVLVGTLTKENPNDFARTPYSRHGFTASKMMIHASILNSIIKNDGILPTPRWVTAGMTWLVSSLVIWWVLLFTPMLGVFFTLTLTAVIVAFSVFAFMGVGGLSGLWLQISYPLIGIFLSYYLAVPYRLIREYQTRWDYQRKNEILTKVEELKTNFLSLVTHDLKTPVARIQGLAEVILRKSQQQLAETDQSSLKGIVRATEDLNRFISSILELSKLESSRLKLEFESKDLNHLIERTIENFSIQARNKKITIRADLEPLFPIKIDTNSISKVLNNLIDNAIKYSESGSTVTIQSREVGDFVEVSVQDNGIGLSPDDLENIFTKFFRAKNKTTEEVGGSGLGLYLTRYFVEAHQGNVQVESQIGKGSIFKIRIPVDIDSIPGLKVNNFFSKSFNSNKESQHV